MWTESFQMFKLDLEEAEESEIKFPTSIGSLKKQENSRKTSTSALLTLPKPLIMWITTNCGTFLKKQEYQTTLPISWETYMQVMKQVRTEQGTMDWFKIGKGVCQGCMLSPVYLTYMQNISCKILGQMKHKLESRLPGKISITSDMQMTPPLWQKVKRNLLMKMKEESEKAGLKLSIQKTKIMASGPITSWQVDGETVETVTDFILWGSKITADGDCSHDIKRRLLPGRKVMTNLDSIWKNRDVTLQTKVHLVKAMVFPVVKYGCKSWTIKKAECWRIDAFELWCWKRLLRVPWTARRSNQSILKEISPESSLEGLML